MRKKKKKKKKNNSNALKEKVMQAGKRKVREKHQP
ncbi:hypothetical protein QG37_05073 [Candidozyma auris]|uniref:Uncharacterized protein n=1 Tax=Candidozyma auris TaxID=498019 RepID=A0A0L0NVR9_CANAR|nr:hypothetical protein QG37_05073 [[Candida] auris]